MESPPKTFQRAGFDLLLDKIDLTPDSICCLPDLIHFNAVHNGHHSFCIQSRQLANSSQDTNKIKVTFLEFSQAVERCCTWILSNISETYPAELAKDGSVQKSQPIAIYLESGLTLFIYLAALLTLNVPCLLLSIRLNSEAVSHLVKETGSCSIIVSLRTRSRIQAAFDNGSNTGIHMTAAATFEDFLLAPSSIATDLSRFHDCRRMVREDDRNVLVLHSSGSTGFPKPVSLAHRYLLGYAACHQFPATEDMSKSGYNLSTLPLYHGFGVLAPSLAMSVGKPVWFPPSDTIPNGSLIISSLDEARGMITSLMTVPAILEDITLMPDFSSNAAQKLVKLAFVAVGGGGIKDAVGSKLASHGISLLNHFGATELGALAPIFPPDDDYDWRYLRIRSDLGLKLEAKKDQNSNENVSSCKLVGRPFAWNKEFELQDELEANPKSQDSEVRILGRNDDLIILATGENVLPHPLEHALEEHPLVKRAIVFGHGQFEVGVLVEPFVNDKDAPEVFVDKIWPSVKKANDLMDTHARISSKTAILLKPANKDIPLTDKQSVQRKQFYAEFEPEISATYSLLAQDGKTNLAVPLDFKNLNQSLKGIAQSCLPAYNRINTWNDDSDFIALGMDSLQATRFRRILEASVRSAGRPLPTAGDLPLDIIYSNPSISRLAEALDKWLHGLMLSSDSIKEMTGLVEKHAYQQEFSRSDGIGNVVLLSGSTGNLGANLIHLLSEDHLTHKILCLIRLPSGQAAAASREELAARQRKALQDRKITLSEKAWSKITFLPWVLGVEKFGLHEDVYRDVASRISHIFHGAWPMDFKVKVKSLESQVKVVRELLQIARLAHALRPSVRPRVVLASSIAAVGRFPSITHSSMVPEAPMDDPRTPLPIGYAEAKWVCEKVMESAYKYSSELEPIVIRIGQLSGSETTGFWSSKEHFPALVKASHVIGAMPDLQGSLSWIPVDRAARVIMDILLGPRSRELVYHLENPTRQPWPDMCSTIERNTALASARRLPFPEWLNEFAAIQDSSQDLVDFFRYHFRDMSSGGLILGTSKAQEMSSTLRSTGVVDSGAVELYLGFWRSIGFLK